VCVCIRCHLQLKVFVLQGARLHAMIVQAMFVTRPILRGDVVLPRGTECNDNNNNHNDINNINNNDMVYFVHNNNYDNNNNYVLRIIIIIIMKS